MHTNIANSALKLVYFKAIFYTERFFKFFEIDLTIKVNVKRERRFDRPTVIFKFKMRSKICAYIQL